MATEFEKKTLSGKEFFVEKGLIDYIKDADDGRGDYSDRHIQINIDIETNKIWGDFHISSEFSKYRKKSVKYLGDFADKNFDWEDLEAVLEVLLESGYYQDLMHDREDDYEMEI